MMSGPQMAGAIALAVMGFLMIMVSAMSRDTNLLTKFGDHLSKIGMIVGGVFMLPLVLILFLGIMLGFGA